MRISLLSPKFLILQVFLAFSLLLLIKLSDFKLSKVLKFENPPVAIAAGLFAYSYGAYLTLLVQSHLIDRKINLTIERWHTIYPKTTISIVLTAISSYVCALFVVFKKYGHISALIISLFYLFAFRFLNMLH